MRKVSAVHEAIAGDDIYTMKDGNPILLGVKIDKVKSWARSSKELGKLFPLSIESKNGTWHFSKEEAKYLFGLQVA